MTACKCGHVSVDHLERVCTGSPVCGCREFRPEDGQRWPGERTHEQDNREDVRRADEFRSRPNSYSDGRTA